MVQDKELLTQIHESILRLINQNLEKTDFWEELDEDQQRELDLAIQESYDEENLIDHETAIERLRTWIRKE